VERVTLSRKKKTVLVGPVPQSLTHACACAFQNATVEHTQLTGSPLAAALMQNRTPLPPQSHALGGAADSSSSSTPSAVIRSIIQPVKSSNRRSSARDVVRYFTVLTSLVTFSTSAPSLPRYFQLCLVYSRTTRGMRRQAHTRHTTVYQVEQDTKQAPSLEELDK